jgi:uracil-DNA glycosylase
MTVHVTLPTIGTFAAWRGYARGFAVQGTPSTAITWGFEKAASLFDEGAADLPLAAETKNLRVPARFLKLAEDALCHRDPQRFHLLYDLLTKLQKDANRLDDPSDACVAKLAAMQKSVRRDSHKMKAFVRFREIGSEGGRRRFMAWFEPEHYIIERTAPFFARRFADMDWLIATPTLTARLENGALDFAETEQTAKVPSDGTDELWKTYFTNVFNPARLKPKAMMSEMPKKYWKNLPEAELIPALIADAPARVERMRAALASSPSVRTKSAVASVIPAEYDEAAVMSLPDARQAASVCMRCPLGQKATQTVFGEGPANAHIMFVGEQPGDQEDLAGKAFIGPAGRLFDAALAEAGIERKAVYVTNAVKHFKYEPRGKRRLHQRPNAGEIMACKWWLEKELAIIKPRLIVALGATAAHSLTGNGEGILRRRGSVEHLNDGTPVFMTVHPSSILRIPDHDAAEDARRRFVVDLNTVRAMITQ